MKFKKWFQFPKRLRIQLPDGNSYKNSCLALNTDANNLVLVEQMSEETRLSIGKVRFERCRPCFELLKKFPNRQRTPVWLRYQFAEWEKWLLNPSIAPIALAFEGSDATLSDVFPAPYQAYRNALVDLFVGTDAYKGFFNMDLPHLKTLLMISRHNNTETKEELQTVVRSANNLEQMAVLAYPVVDLEFFFQTWHIFKPFESKDRVSLVSCSKQIGIMGLLDQQLGTFISSAHFRSNIWTRTQCIYEIFHK
jgi:hypothetical protein